MSIYIITGKLGTYKTTLATIFAVSIMEAMPWMKGIKGNFKMNVPDFEYISSFDDLLDTYNSCVVIDEAHEHANSRRSNAAENVQLTKLGTITRKQNIELLFVSPRYGSIDLNIRGIADYVMRMQLKGNTIIQTVYEPHEFKDDELVEIGTNTFKEEDLQKFYSLFDTRDKTRDFTSKKVKQKA